MPAKTIYVPDEGEGAWQEFAQLAEGAKMSVSALLMLLVRACVDGTITMRTETVITTVEKP